MRKIKIILFISLNILFSLNSYSQFAIGASVIKNFQSEALGFGARLHIHLGNRLVFSPQASIYPKFNKVNEYYVGANLELGITKRGLLNFYLIGGGGYNGWMNHEDFHNSVAQYSNWDAEVGLGVTTNKWCIKPFAEYRYNFKWKETMARIGILFVFGKCDCRKGKGKGGGGKGKHRKKGKKGCWSYY